MNTNLKIYAVIDTNVIVSSFISKNRNSNPGLVMQHVLRRRIIPLYNEEILQEYKRVLSRDKFHLSDSQVTGIIQIFRELGINADRVPVEDFDFPDPDDIVFYEIKLSKEDSYLVTGNLKHFPQTPLVVTPAQMVSILKSV